MYVIRKIFSLQHRAAVSQLRIYSKALYIKLLQPEKNGEIFLCSRLFDSLVLRPLDKNQSVLDPMLTELDRRLHICGNIHNVYIQVNLSDSVWSVSIVRSRIECFLRPGLI